MGLRHGDPLMVYRWPHEAVVAAHAWEEARTLDHNEEQARLEAERAGGSQPGRPAVPARSTSALLSHPNVAPCSPAAARFWGTP